MNSVISDTGSIIIAVDTMDNTLQGQRETLINSLFGRIAALCGARNIKIFLYMPRFLCSVRLAFHPARRINQCFQRTTLIKMDIEGAELNALMGAEQTIRKHKSKLAICACHRANDLITIPQYIKSLVSEYKLFFRVHICGTIVSVLYAICIS